MPKGTHPTLPNTQVLMKMTMKRRNYMTNPLISQWETPFGTHPFDQIKPGHFKDGIEEAIKIAESEIVRITSNQEPPSFENTIKALERSGVSLGRITSLLFNLNSAET